jgi:hypothetical protein
MSLNEITPNPDHIQLKDIKWKSNVIIMSCFMVFGLIWIVFFIQDKIGFICMVSASSYYFSSSAE